MYAILELVDAIVSFDYFSGRVIPGGGGEMYYQEQIKKYDLGYFVAAGNCGVSTQAAL